MQRQTAQGFVEYGLIVAVVAFLAMIGLSQVNGAEEAVLSGKQLAPQPPATGFGLHQTSTAISCPLTTVVADNTSYLDCTAEVDDLSSPAFGRRAPHGT